MICMYECQLGDKKRSLSIFWSEFLKIEPETLSVAPVKLPTGGAGRVGSPTKNNEICGIHIICM